MLSDCSVLASSLRLLWSRQAAFGPPAKPDSGRYPGACSGRSLIYREDCLAFLFDLSVPFTNNEAERGVRMLKVKGKISGCFRTFEGATRFCRFRSYLQTCGKQGLNRLDCLISVFRGEPILPALQMDG